MGDTGSLALGGLFASIMIFSGNALYIPIIGIMFVLSGISVIIQVGYYKLTKKKPVYTKMAIKTLNDKKTFDNTLAKKELGLKETEFQVIVNKTIEWFKRF